MRVDAFFTPAERAAADLAGRTAVVIDVLRATTTMVEALANGARGIVPVASTEAAVRIAQDVGRDTVLLCGERRCVRIEGFDLGNSPAEFTPERIGGKTLIMTTTNGTPALAAAVAARDVLVASFLNLGAIVDALAEREGDVSLICSSREGQFALEDALCAGAVATRLRERRAGAEVELNDAALAAEALFLRYGDRLAEVLHRTGAGRLLDAVGLSDDIARCVAVDRHPIVPRYREQKVSL